MTSGPFCLLEHVKDKAELTQHARVVQAARGSVLKGHITQKRSVVHELQE